jgi:hypothetical protein
MCPFNKVPDGFSPEMLELLDRTFAATWSGFNPHRGPLDSTGEKDDNARRRAGPRERRRPGLPE